MNEDMIDFLNKYDNMDRGFVLPRLASKFKMTYKEAKVHYQEWRDKYIRGL